MSVMVSVTRGELWSVFHVTNEISHNDLNCVQHVPTSWSTLKDLVHLN